MITLTHIDVTILDQETVLPTILKLFDELDINDSFIVTIKEDIDLYKQHLIGFRGNSFLIEYIKNTPEQKQIKIEKINSPHEITIGEIVTTDYRKANILKQFNIDFCCGGKKTLSQACKEKNINIQDIEAEFNRLNTYQSKYDENYNGWPLTQLIDYIIDIHHSYIKRNSNSILEFINRVAKVHGNENIELKTISELFKQLIDELDEHMLKEENILFPYIKKLEANTLYSEKKESYFPTIKKPIQVMEHEHEEVGTILKAMRELSNNYTPPSYACNTYKIAYKLLDEFENDLHQHIHLENNILFPKSIFLEAQQINN